MASIGVEKGDRVKADQVRVRLEDDEYRARMLESQGQLETLKARLAEAEHGSRPEEIAKAKADVEQARADQENARVTLERARGLVQDKVMAKQTLDDAQARYDGAAAKVIAIRKSAGQDDRIKIIERSFLVPDVFRLQPVEPINRCETILVAVRTGKLNDGKVHVHLMCSGDCALFCVVIVHDETRVNYSRNPAE